ncbi:unnamed protein product [Orchesella dallaii]|uniref:Uncharacterized protein n=1 Tax=Orchesella dallaii TaxID=48710 RepID=A0ABP1RXX8_9HEXA
MNRNTNFQQQSRHPSHHPPYPPVPQNCNDMNPWFCDTMLPPQNGANPFDIRPQFTKTPLLSNPYPNPATSKVSDRSSVPVRPTDRNFVSQEVHQAVLNKNRMYVDQLKHSQEENKDLKRQIAELQTTLLQRDKRIEKVDSLRKNANARNKQCSEEKFMVKTRCDNIIREIRNEWRAKIRKLKDEVTIFKSELKDEEDRSLKLSGRVRTLQKTLLQLKKTLESHKSSHKKDLETQQQEFNRKLEDCSEAVENEIQQYKSLLRKMNKLKKENLDIQEQMNKIKQENSNLMSKLEIEKEKPNCKCECAIEAEELNKLQQSKDSEVQFTRKRKMPHTLS